MGFDKPLDGTLSHFSLARRITINPYVLARMKISGKPNRRPSEAANQNACVKTAEVVMLGYIELLASFAMNHPRPARMVFHNMTIGKNLVPGNKNAGSKPNPVAFWIRNLDFINSRLDSVWIGISSRNRCVERQKDC